ncbi:MAG TPA: hypothetical protein VHS99_08520 [Chloroflexota bacterium]|jgi:hypothetical protein|nr:hypothetical protein [Chloroflexota bacterium]
MPSGPRGGAPGAAADPYTIDGRPFVGIQVGAVSFVDEGTDALLDLFRDRAGVNAVLLASHTFDRGTGGRQIPGHPLPDHGVQAYDPQFRGGNFATIHREFYAKTAIGDFRAPDHGDLDIIAEVLGPAHRRGLRVYAWINENPHGPIPRLVPNFPKVLEIDVHGRRAHTPCFNHPDYKYWWLSIVEDYVKSYAIDGLAWCSERQGPLGSMIGGQGAAGITCFCEHCRALAQERGLSAERARRGFVAMADFLDAARRGERPSDGYFVTFWRLLLEFPELLAWERLWVDGQHGMYAEIYGVAKAIRREVQVGWHVMHHNSFSPFYRAEQDYRKLAPYSDFIKVVAYHNCAGPRYAAFHRMLASTIFADARPEASLELMYGILGVDEASLDELPGAGWSADYVRRETQRAVAGVGGAVAILPGIDVDIPTGEGQTRCTPQSTRAAVEAAFAGGARGVILSRKYSEMRLPNLFAVKEALAAAAGQR